MYNLHFPRGVQIVLWDMNEVFFGQVYYVIRLEKSSQRNVKGWVRLMGWFSAEMNSNLLDFQMPCKVAPNFQWGHITITSK